MRFRHFAPLAALALGGCIKQVDDPSNLPLRGKWQQESKLVTLVANDVWLDRKDAPFPLPEDKTEVKGCFEPKLKTADQINEDLLQGTAKNCKFGEIVKQGHDATADGVCEEKKTGPYTVSGKMDFTESEAPDKIDATVSATMFVRTPAGASQRVRFAAQVKWTRLGDCGS